MNPDEATLALWLDDELTGMDLAAVEVWALEHPEQIAAREEIRRWRATVAASIPASQEPPYSDFFNSKVLQSIREQGTRTGYLEKKSSLWKSWLMPSAACAGMALAFWAGTKSHSTPDYDVAGAPRAILVEPVVYTPETGVNAELIATAKASATVIVLNGVTAIPDSTDFSETAYLKMDPEIDSTAGTEIESKF